MAEKIRRSEASAKDGRHIAACNAKRLFATCFTSLSFTRTLIGGRLESMSITVLRAIGS